MKVGVTIIEVTLRTPVAYEEIREINENLPPELFVGAGTVTSKKTLERALHARSDFIVITAITSSLVRSLQDCPVSVFPGVAKPGGALEIFEAGFSYFKFFPAESIDGVKALKSICDPMPEIKYMPPAKLAEIRLENIWRSTTYLQ